MSLQMFAGNKMLGGRVLAANEVDEVEGDDRLKRMEPKTKRSES